jgi:hypothetical protein
MSFLKKLFGKKQLTFEIKFTEEEVTLMIDNLRQAIYWTNALAQHFDYEEGNYGTVFRQTNPEISGTKLYKIEGNYTTWEIDDYSTSNYEKVLKLLIEERGEKSNKNQPLDIDKNGRIIVFLTQVTTHDGAPISESEGFVDEGDIPPLDTWFFLKDKFYRNENELCDLALFCWIPKKFESKIQAAIDVEIMDSYDWLDELYPDFNDQIMNYL